VERERKKKEIEERKALEAERKRLLEAKKKVCWVSPFAR
jgi:hypothetical protein